VHHIDAVQIEYSPFAIDIENPDIGLLKACRELGVATVAYSPLGRFVSQFHSLIFFVSARHN
jgi:diketogulonate reductase-like aldo/keto reductase